MSSWMRPNRVMEFVILLFHDCSHQQSLKNTGSKQPAKSEVAMYDQLSPVDRDYDPAGTLRSQSHYSDSMYHQLDRSSVSSGGSGLLRAY
jgi:hypothetical protein